MKSSLPPEWESFNKLELPHQSIEEEVSGEAGLYKGLDPLALYTPPEDLLSLFRSPFCQGTWLDLGAGVGHTAILYGLYYPERKALGVEKASSRVAFGRELVEKLKLTNVNLIEDDLMTMDLPEAQTCFLYFPTGPVLDRVLDQVKAKKIQTLMCIESHGDLIPRLQKENWLEVVETIPLKGKRHFDQAMVFRKKETQQESGPHQVSYLDKILLIEDNAGRWIGDSLGLEWLKENVYQLQNPPRSIDWSQVKEIGDPELLPPEVQFLRTLRPRGEVLIRTRRGSYRGFLRKILLEPSFGVEISTGEWVQWKEVQFIHSGNHLCYDSSLGFFSLPPAPLA